jgi:phasin family protein
MQTQAAPNFRQEFQMYVTPEQVVAGNKAGVEALLGFAHTQFAAFERISALTFNATKAAFEDSVAHTKALMNAKDPQDLMNLSTTVAQPAIEKAIAYSRSVYEVASQSHGEVSKMVEAQAGEFNKTVVTFLDKIAKNAPAGSDVAVAAMKSALAAASTAYDSVSKAARQATDIAEANFSAATTAVRETRKKAA